ncbi:MAG: excinuclease ABC subunit C [Ignavibacteria bacterium GWB2_35_12]|nr:MAG: excinuclease ABC subunit C [Ignavibacteria bacterium GWA2_35_8]OGU39302.1 MAG: excinuclease ABC subunit C [Ignavibacteria bacterium GWB2_35_12]OGU92838.1 MAG: excinuclease ABC subunit C [Ignavibacteria bacterium RIFOXYA2_FULL_35_10]OGV21185.1 MAG: excinuclease ABC subunit C [Ignavibacteria bacterium RIFOXYC2_FULL_35_21]
MNNDNINIESEVLGLQEKLKSLPTNPGIYQFKNQIGKIIYIGKAKNLRNRVKSYFQTRKPVDAKTKVLIQKIKDVEVIVTDSETEALILEDTLVKKYRPKYNILLKDDKSFPYVRLTNEPYPRIFATRKVIKDGSKYFGPYTEVRQLKILLKTIRSLFLMRSCDYNLTDESVANKKYKLCLDYHIKKCEGPCEGLISREQYNENVRQAVQIINGKTREIERKLECEMDVLSEQMKFEEATIVRNRYLILKDYLSHQKIVSTETIDRDVIALARINDSACILIFQIRDGKLIGRRHYIISNTLDQTDEYIIQVAIEKWYLETNFIPNEILLQTEPEQLDFIIEWLEKISGYHVDIQIPKIGEKKKLINMAVTNADFLLREYHLAMAKREQAIPKILHSIQRDLRLSKPPRRIECFDNSHIQGSELVSSMVVFVDGKPKKSDYRRYKIQTVDHNDDFAAMREVISRRYDKSSDEKSIIPDLIIIDGGKGQLSSAVQILKKAGLSDKTTVIGLAKRIDEIFFPGKSEPLLLPKTSSSLKLIQHLRDEAHRFAITYHRLLRSKRTLQTELTEIPGIGEKIAQKLLIQLNSVEKIKNSDLEELTDIVGHKAAERVFEYFNKTEIQQN